MFQEDSPLLEVDPEIAEIIAHEKGRQVKCWERVIGNSLAAKCPQQLCPMPSWKLTSFWPVDTRLVELFATLIRFVLFWYATEN